MSKTIDLKALLESKMKAVEPAQDAQKAIELAEVSVPRNLMYDAESSEFIPVLVAYPMPTCRVISNLVCA